MWNCDKYRLKMETKIKWYEFLNPILWICLMIISIPYLVFQSRHTLMKLYKIGYLDLK